MPRPYDAEDLAPEYRESAHASTTPEHVIIATQEKKLPLVASRGLATKAGLKITKWHGRLVDTYTRERKDYHTICFNSAGATVRRTDKRTRSLTAGTYFIQSASTCGGFESDGPLEYFHFYLCVDMLRKLAAELRLGSRAADEFPEIFGFHDPGLAALTEACLTSLMPGHPPSRIELDCWAQAFGAYLLRENPRFSRLSLDVPVRTISSARLERVIEYVEGNLASDLSLTALAGISGVPSARFLRAFKESVGMTPFQFVLKRRIARASHLLRQPEKSIAEIAYEAGFASQSHMTDVFSKRLGMPPGKFRAEHQEYH